MKASETSGENDQDENAEDSVLLSRTRVLELSFVDNDNVK